MPAPYYLSVEQTDLQARRESWKCKKAEGFVPGVKWLGRDQAPDERPGGLVAKVNADGAVEARLDVWGVEGLCATEAGLLAAGPWDIWRIDPHLTHAERWFSEPWCNYLHTLRCYGDRVMVAATGADAIYEIELGTGRTTWCWRAADFGYSRRRPTLEAIPQGDLRGFKIDTLLHRTHVNSATALGPASVLATLFHQGQLVSIERASGRVNVLVDDLVRPHAVRAHGADLVSLADTGRGRGLLIQLSATSAELTAEVTVATTWLQDALWTTEGWILVDGEYARVIHTDHDGKTVRIDQFPDDWRLFEVLPAPWTSSSV